LCEDVMQIVAKADKGKALFEEFSNAGSAEEEESQNDVILPCRRGELVRRVHQFGRSVHIGELVLLIQSHGHAEVVLAQEENVHALNGRDLIDVFDTVGGLDL